MLEFTPLKDDALRKSRKFVGLHRRKLTGPGAQAVGFGMRYARVFAVAAVLAVVLGGGYLGYELLNQQYGEAALVQADAREAALEAGGWQALSSYVRDYPDEAGDGRIALAMTQAFQDELSRLASVAQDRLASGDGEITFEEDLAALDATWVEVMGGSLPEPLARAAEEERVLFNRDALGGIERRLRDAAERAAVVIEGGAIEEGIEDWTAARTVNAGIVSATELDHVSTGRITDAAARGDERVGRAIEQALRARMRVQVEVAQVDASDTPTSAYVDLVATINEALAAAERYEDAGHLSAQARIDVEEEAGRVREDMAIEVRQALESTLEAAGAQATQAISRGLTPIADVLVGYATMADGLIETAVRDDLPPFHVDRLHDTDNRNRRDIRDRALTKSVERGSIAGLDALESWFAQDDAEFLSEIRKAKTKVYLDSGDLDGASAVAEGPDRAFALFGHGVQVFWDRGDTVAAVAAFEQLDAVELTDTGRERDVARLRTIADGYRALFAAPAGALAGAMRNQLSRAGAVVLDASSPTAGIEGFSVAYLRLLGGEASSAGLLFGQFADDPQLERYPVRYYQTVAAVVSGDQTAIGPLAITATADPVSAQRLQLLRYLSHVEWQGNVFDTTAIEGADQILQSGNATEVAMGLAREIGRPVSLASVAFTIGMIRAAYHGDPDGALRRLIRIRQEPQATVVVQLESLWDAVARSSEPASPAALLERLGRIRAGLPSSSGGGPESLWVEALVSFHEAYQNPDPRADAGPYQRADSRFATLARSHAAYAPMANMMRGRIAQLRGNSFGAQERLEAAIEAAPRYAEAYTWLGDVYGGREGEEAQRRSVQLLRTAAGLGGGVVAPSGIAKYLLAELPPEVLTLVTGSAAAASQARARYVRGYREWHAAAGPLAGRLANNPSALSGTGDAASEAIEPSSGPILLPAAPRPSPDGRPEASPNPRTAPGRDV